MPSFDRFSDPLSPPQDTPSGGEKVAAEEELTPETEAQLELLLRLLGELEDPPPTKAQSDRPKPSLTNRLTFKAQPPSLPLLPPASPPHRGRLLAPSSDSEAEDPKNLPQQQTESISESIESHSQAETSGPISSADRSQETPDSLSLAPEEQEILAELDFLISDPSPANRRDRAETQSPSQDNPPSEPLEDDLLVQLQTLLVSPNMMEAGEQVGQLNDKLAQIEQKITQPKALIDLLLPVVAELLERKVIASQEEMCKALFPIIDQMIYQRAKQDREAVSSALAEVIPAAISKELQNSPEEIVSAIAPAMGAAIKEQIRLDRNVVVQALAPEMGRTIKRQIELERDVMVDALYPVIGSTIRRYLAEAIQEINTKVANALSVEGIKRKIRAKVQGVSEAELILQEALPAKVQAVFLIHKASGLMISDAHQSGSLRLDGDMVAGMLTAIRSFVNDCIAQSGGDSELNEIEYGDSKILLEVAGYCYLAVVVQGDPPRHFIEKIRNALSYLIQKYGDPIEQFDGDPETVPEGVRAVTETLMDLRPETAKRRRIPWTLLGVGGILALILAIPWGWARYRQGETRRLGQEALSALYAAPELSVYRFSTEAQGETLTLKGRVPSEFLRDRAEEIVRSVAVDRAIDNQILAVEVPPDPEFTAAEVQRIVALFDREPGVQIKAQYETLPGSPAMPPKGKVEISGKVERSETLQELVRTFEAIPGVHTVSSRVIFPSPNISTRIYFPGQSAQLQPVDIQGKIGLLQQSLKRYPEIRLRIVGHSHPSESGDSSQLAIARATAVKTILVERGIDPARLEVQGSAGSPSDVRADAPKWLSQCVRFETILPTPGSNPEKQR